MRSPKTSIPDSFSVGTTTAGLGVAVGVPVGVAVGAPVGVLVGVLVGVFVGVFVGVLVGATPTVPLSEKVPLKVGGVAPPTMSDPMRSQSGSRFAFRIQL